MYKAYVDGACRPNLYIPAVQLRLHGKIDPLSRKVIHS